MKLDDAEGHTLNFYEAKGAGTGSNGEFTFSNQGSSDLVKGNGPHSGYFKATDKNGHVYFSKWQGKVTTTKSPEGKPIMKWEGTWSFLARSIRERSDRLAAGSVPPCLALT